MARKHKHEDHMNHEAWAIPYGDLITLLLAFFVVMYSMSSVNEGKYRILSESLRAAFRGAPKSTEPVQIGSKPARSKHESPPMSVSPQRYMQLDKEAAENQPPMTLGERLDELLRDEQIAQALDEMADEVEQAMKPLINADMIRVTRKRTWLEVEIKTDILFPSGSADIADDARPVLQDLANVMARFDNPIRVEGHTDDKPINTAEFPSNWELSAARAAGVVHLFTDQGVKPQRLVVTGMGEYSPAMSNDSAEGRGRNRRVVLVVLATPEMARENLPLSSDVESGQEALTDADGGSA
ncbi:MAG: flagellar motor protein MotD [Gammaproteobacteria bacterium]|nr:flagellar motor protein MotD [Gammaproteobacteria bacterium]